MREGTRDSFSSNIILMKYVACAILISNYFCSTFNSILIKVDFIQWKSQVSFSQSLNFM